MTEKRQTLLPCAATLALLAAMISGCAPRGTAPLAVVGQAQEKSPAAALAVPGPGGPQIVSVIERRFSDGVRQRIVLETPAETRGENHLRLDIRGGGDRTRKTELDIETVSATVAGEEIADLFPGLDMVPAGAFARNAYGPFGYATAPGAGKDRCIYAWQSLGVRVKAPDATLRLRFCARGASRAGLLDIMRAMTVPGYTGDAAFSPPTGRFTPSTATWRAGSEVIPPAGATTATKTAAEPARRQASPPRPAPAAGGVKATRQIAPIGSVPPHAVPDVPAPSS